MSSADNADGQGAPTGTRLDRWRARAENTLDLLRERRLTDAWQTPFSVLHEASNYRLRRYVHTEGPVNQPVQGPLLLVPPLMVASEIYDISPEQSAIAWLTAHGVDVWLVDFGAPELEEGGLQRTLDDHVLAVDDAINRVRETCGEDVHLAGYSQGGMFVYQCAAYRRSAGIRSLITFGTPVDVHRNVPAVGDAGSEAVIRGPARLALGPLKLMDSLPGAMSMAGFKLLSGSKELRHMFGILPMLHDRKALEHREQRRRFLGGEGFVAWPGPALRVFIDEMVINNRMLTGGFVINGRSLTLADITVPVLYFVGSRDEFARPASARAIRDAAPKADVQEVELASGHFGLVVGSRARAYTWPTVAAWMRWKDGDGPAPDFAPENLEAVAQAPAAEGRIRRLYGVAADYVDELREQAGDVSAEIGDILDAFRWEIPRKRKLRSLHEEQRTSIAGLLTEQARALPEATFLIWENHAQSYGAVNLRVNRLTAALLECGVEAGQHVGVQMDNHPDFICAIAALNRIGAVGVLLNASMCGSSLEHALIEARVSAIAADAAHIGNFIDVCPELPLMVLGERCAQPTPELLCLEEYLDAGMPVGFEPNRGRAGDVAVLIFTSGTTGQPKAVKITNRRWSMAALTTAAIARMTPRDTVYCCTPLYHATGMLMAVGGALAGGARLALAEGFSASGFLNDVRRSGVTVVFYVGEMCRYLVNQQSVAGEHQHALRLLIGNGMRPDVWRAIQERFQPKQIIEFYGSSEGNVVLANLSGEKIGSIGQPLNQERDIALVRYDPDLDEFLRGDSGKLQCCGADEPGVLLARIDDSHPMSMFDGYTSDMETENRILRNVFEAGDAWFCTDDLMRFDAEGDYWFLDRLGDTYRWLGENVSTRQVEDTLSELPFVANVTVYGVRVPNREGRAGVAAIELAPGQSFDPALTFAQVSANLTVAARPRVIRLVESLPTTETMKNVKYRLRMEGVEPTRISDPLYFYNEYAESYHAMTDGGALSQIN